MNNPLQLFRDYVKKKGLKDTPQREEVLTFLLKATQHMSPEDIFHAMRKTDPKIGRATVFRTLKLLEESGLASHILSADGRHMFEANSGKKHHDHMICVSCGQTLEFESPAIERLQNTLARRYGFEIFRHRHELFGKCRKCLRH